MTGNDIVDLKTASLESNWQRKGFLEKLFTLKEQQYIEGAASPFQMVWKLWSMKESAYKVHTRQYGGRFFAPQKLSCTFFNESSGMVTIHHHAYQTITLSTDEYIYSMARMKKSTGVDYYNHCFRIPHIAYASLQKYIYEKLVAYYAGISGEDKNDFTLFKEKNNIPFLHGRSGKVKLPVSLTHHGNYAAFTIN